MNTDRNIALKDAHDYLQRVIETLRYYRYFPSRVEPFVPAHALDAPPAIYTGPEGLYGTIREHLNRLGILNHVRRLVGLRLIMTARFYAQYSRVPATEHGLPPADAEPPRESPGRPVPAPDREARTISDGVNVIGFIQ